MIDSRFARVICAKAALASHAIGNARELLQLHIPAAVAANLDPAAWY